MRACGKCGPRNACSLGEMLFRLGYGDRLSRHIGGPLPDEWRQVWRGQSTAPLPVKAKPGRPAKPTVASEPEGSRVDAPAGGLSDPMHLNGRCECADEGVCEWCRDAELERLREISTRSLLSMAQVDWLFDEVRRRTEELDVARYGLSQAHAKFVREVDALKPDAEAWQKQQRERRERDDAAERGGDW